MLIQGGECIRCNALWLLHPTRRTVCTSSSLIKHIWLPQSFLFVSCQTSLDFFDVFGRRQCFGANTAINQCLPDSIVVGDVLGGDRRLVRR